MKIFKIMGLTLFFTLVSFSCVSAQTVDDLILMTEQYPPYNFEEDGKLQGFFIDVMERMLEKLNSKLTRDDIRLLPWANAYNKALNKKNTALFGIVRTKEREDLFKWVGPMDSVKIVLTARKDRNVKISSVDDVKGYRIGIIRNDAAEQLLIQAGIEKNTLERVAKAAILIKMLNAGKIDMWGYNEAPVKWLLKKNDLNTEDYETVYTLKEVDAYYAFHKDTPDLLIRNFQNALDGIKKKTGDGGKSEHEKIMDKYLK
ncbi:MAG: amino acid ABC transporter substrate-binding protein [Deltaproteobacteria bacterium]|nr:MAG: amino acid ABC transporter substrate-binding protein [Deltaproteobacteria bacterium]